MDCTAWDIEAVGIHLLAFPVESFPQNLQPSQAVLLPLASEGVVCGGFWPENEKSQNDSSFTQDVQIGPELAHIRYFIYSIE